jgi:glycosyltransferase involved in cell wall biosynthesis
VRILAIVYCFPPLLVPAALCYLKLVLGLRARGAEVEVLAIDPRSFLAPGAGLEDPAIMRVIPDDLVQLTVWSPEANRVVRVFKRLLRTTPLGMRFFEPKKREWVAPALRRLNRVDLGRYDIVLTCSQPHTNHLVGLRLKERERIPWIAYFSDPWSRNPYARFANQRVADYHRSLETKVLATADRVLFTSDEMLRLAAEDHAAELKGKAGVLPHSFVPQWYGPARESSQSSGRPGPMRVLHTGHFYGPRSPAPLLRALSRLQQRRDLVGRLEIDSYGSFPDRDREDLARNGLDRVVRVHPVIPYLDSLELMRQHDLLLLVDAKLTQTAESVFLPSKLVDYLGSGTPVMAVTPVPGTTARVVAETGGIVCDIEKEDAIEEALSRLLDEGPPPPPEPAAVRPYHYEEVSGRLLAIASGLLGEGASGG